MSGGIRAGIRGMSGAGLLVVGTLCGALVLVVLTACAFALLHPDRDLPEYLGQLLLTLTPLVAGLLAKTYADSKGDGADPAPPLEVDATLQVEPGTSVLVEDGGAAHELEGAPTARHRR